MAEILESWCARIKYIIAKKSSIELPKRCLIWHGSVRRTGAKEKATYGMISIKLPGSNKRTLKTVHRVAYMAHTADINLPRECDVSHLCQNSLCVCFEHLSLEPRAINNSRKICKRRHECQGHGQYRNCII